jgi:transcriptional regulator with XRE-family HTH domain
MSMPPKAKGTKQKKSEASPASAERTIAHRLHELRKLAGVSQEAMGAQGFVSAPGWIKMENGQRSPSEKLLTAFVTWLVEEKVVRANHKVALLDELCALKYASHGNAFLREMAREHLATLSRVKI